MGLIVNPERLLLLKRLQSIALTVLSGPVREGQVRLHEKNVFIQEMKCIPSKIQVYRYYRWELNLCFLLQHCY